MAFRGFAPGLGDILTFMVIGILKTGFHLFGVIFLFAPNPNLKVLAELRLLQAGLGIVLWSINILVRPGLHERMGLTWRSRGGSGGGGAALVAGNGSATSGARSSKTAILKDGLYAMIVEVSNEFAKTISVYFVAVTLGAGAFYQVSANTSAYQIYGLALASAALINMKLTGSQFIMAGLHKHFTWLLEFCTVFCVLVGLVFSTWQTLPHTLGISFNLGEQACQYAAESACLPIYEGVFGGGLQGSGTSIQQTMYTVSTIMLIRAMYRLVRSGLYACQDFKWMAKISIGCFICIFLPAIVLWHYFLKTTLAAVFIMVVPNIVATFAFGWRLRSNLHKMSRSEAGPWGTSIDPETAARSFLRPASFMVGDGPSSFNERIEQTQLGDVAS